MRTLSAKHNPKCCCFECAIENMQNRRMINDIKTSLVAGTIFVIVVMGISLCFASETQYSNEEIVQAIYIAEGGSNAKYPYGIKSVKCEGKEDCYKVCLRTVKNNRKRFKEYGHEQYPSFIQFLGSRYCPTKGRNLSKSEKLLNKNWIKNVEHHLKKNRGAA